MRLHVLAAAWTVTLIWQLQLCRASSPDPVSGIFRRADNCPTRRQANSFLSMLENLEDLSPEYFMLLVSISRSVPAWDLTDRKFGALTKELASQVEVFCPGRLF